MKRINRKGFTLIEILAVIIIIAVLMIIAVPAVTKYINSTKLNTYKSTLKNMISTVNNEVIAGHRESYDFDEEVEYLIMPLVCVELEKGDNQKSPFANYVSAYSFIIVEGTSTGYSYKVQALDETGLGTYLIKSEEIKIEELNVNNLSYITKTVDDNGNTSYGINLKNYSNTKTPYIFTCDALEESEMPSISEDEEQSNLTPTSVLLKDQILKDNTEYADNTSSQYVSTSTGINFGAISSDTNGKGLYYTSTNTEDSKTTYYFRGAVTNNYVQFGQYTSDLYYGYYEVGDPDFIMYNSLSSCQGATEYNASCTKIRSSGDPILWRIVRINEDGSVRLVTEDVVVNSQFNPDYRDNAYVGYMYGTVGATGDNAYNKTHANITDSTVKGAIDTWYTTNLSSYSSYLADVGFCNDRSLYSGSGYGTNYTVYGAYNRLTYARSKTIQPQFACPNEDNDLFTTSSSSKGNKSLTYPIGLITADEVAYAGGTNNVANTNYYLYKGNFMMTMSPAIFNSPYANEWLMNYGDGKIVNDVMISGTFGVRPVINLKSTITLSSEIPSGCTKQEGTASCPYMIKIG